jgi:hypothetical protein
MQIGQNVRIIAAPPGVQDTTDFSTRSLLIQCVGNLTARVYSTRCAVAGTAVVNVSEPSQTIRCARKVAFAASSNLTGRWVAENPVLAGTTTLVGMLIR